MPLLAEILLVGLGICAGVFGCILAGAWLWRLFWNHTIHDGS